eukprot:TRINITY_DN17365_c0_g1_i1.p1 TRINITY_DN17365_c0_g1~~TRINITY_DN17365_c0_g1_i1.p1  ORF type:complete len:296 (-),score=90.51 TRINITY_DN17365_c0_g1_i1:177-1064(-)
MKEKRRAKEEDDNEEKLKFQYFTKYVPNIFQRVPKPADVRSAIERARNNLQVDCIDLVQLHWWDYNIGGMVDTAKVLAELKEEGVIASVGVTNMNTAALTSILNAGVPVVSNQVQFSLLDRRPLTSGLLQFCAERDIKLLTYGTLAGGLLSDRYLPHPSSSESAAAGGGPSIPNLFGKQRPSRAAIPELSTSSLKMYWRVVREAGGADYWQELLKVLRKVAERHGERVSVANVALRWAMDQGAVHPIVGMRSSSNLDENLRVGTLKLGEEDTREINAVLKKSKGPEGDCYDWERS